MTRRLPTHRPRRAGALVAACAVAIAACTVNAAPAPTSMVPLIDPADLPITTLAPTTTALPITGRVDPLLTQLPEGDCAFADAPIGGEITFIVGDRLYGASPDGSVVRCLLQIDSTQRGRVRWSPVANRALLGPATVFDVNGVRSSGFDPSADRIQWEHPVGDSLIAPTSSSYTVVRRSATDAGRRSDATFLGITVAVISHPSGEALIGAGLTRDRDEGVFAADPDGRGLRPLALAEGDLTFLELAADPTGQAVLVLSSKGDSVRIHRVGLADLVVTELVAQPTPMQLMAPAPSGDTVAWRSGLCNSTTSALLVGGRDRAPVLVGEGTPLQTRSAAPVGWLDASTLVVTGRTFGCDGPAEIWLWNLAEGSATLLVTGADAAAVRAVQPRASLPATDPAAQPGAI